MKSGNAKELIRKYLDGDITSEEKAMLESWYLEHSRSRDNSKAFDYNKIEDEIWQEIQRDIALPKRQTRLWYTIGAAASVILLAVALLFYHFKDRKNGLIGKPDHASIQPGGNKATLTLADGTRILLDDTQSGFIKNEGGVKINKTSEGLLIYDALENHKRTSDHEKQLAYNTITTPNGGAYKIILPDGTKVWLNAASSLKFPGRFSGKERIVEMTGETYFEVAKDQNMPFKVISGDVEVNVLGTHFNIMAYGNENNIRTTLIEGSVKIKSTSSEVYLKPGQQATFNREHKSLKVLDGDIEDATAWKKGYFLFRNENIESIMRKIARWYNVDIEYKGDVRMKTFGGTISRFENVAQVLRTMELTGTIHFTIEGRRIIVMP